MQYLLPPKPQYYLAQITDCHLLTSAEAVYNGCQPAQHLKQIVNTLAANQPDAVILTGDLTQDHSAASYQLLAQLLSPLKCPVFVTPGNHDDPQQLQQLMTQQVLRPERSIVLGHWQLLLVNSKGPTPAGTFALHEQHWLMQQLAASQAPAFWLYCHHHPAALNCFIDKHGQQDAQRLWQTLQSDPRIRGIAHGHAHMAYHRQQGAIDIVGCPASSVQFLATPDWQTRNEGPQWCDWFFSADANNSRSDTAGNTVCWQFQQL
mgnify:CR=1 FL=1